MSIKLQSELDVNLTQKTLELLSAELPIFQNWDKLELNKLGDILKVLTFKRNTIILRQNEMIDYVGIILSGRVVIVSNDKIQSFLQEGDLIGYMNFLMLQDTKIAQYDILGDRDGYIGVIKLDEIKNILRKDPYIIIKFLDLCGKKCLNILNYQYSGDYIYKEQNTMTPSNMAFKKLLDLFESNLIFGNLLAPLDKRDKKHFLTSGLIYEFEPENVIARQGNRCQCILMVLCGEIISFQNNKAGQIYKVGSIIGVNEFVYDSDWKENLYGRQKGIYFKLQKTCLNSIAQKSPNSAVLIYRMIIQYQCKQIKDEYQRNNIKEDKQLKNFMKQLEQNNQNASGDTHKNQEQDNIIPEYIELDTSKNLKDGKEVQKQHELAFFQSKIQAPPLYLTDIHKKFLEEAEKTLNNKSKTTTKNNKGQQGSEGMSTFIQEKLGMQQQEKLKKKQELKILEKKGLLPNDSQQFKPNEDYDELKNDYDLLLNENLELRDKINELINKNKQQKEHIKQISDVNILYQSKLKMQNLHKELLRKQIGQNIFSTFRQNNNSSFVDIIQEQLHITKTYLTVTKCAYKWYFKIKRKATNNLNNHLKLL